MSSSESSSSDMDGNDPDYDESDFSDDDNTEYDYDSEDETDEFSDSETEPVTEQGWCLMADPFNDLRPDPLPEYVDDGQAFIKAGVPTFENESQAFCAFFDEQMITQLCMWTNERADEFFRVRVDENNNTSRKVNGILWKNVNQKEMYVFLSLLMIMGVNKLPRIHMYWSNNAMVGGSRIFSRQVMSRSRFLNILKFLRFGPLLQVEKGKPKTRIEPYLQLLRHKCQDILEPGRDIAIDESLRLWKGRLQFKQFIKTKRSRFGIKIYFLCPSDSSFSGYSWAFEVYYGKDSDFNSDDPDASDLSKSEQVVVYLMRNLLTVGRHVITDNWYTSLRLALYLLKKNTLLTGTLRADRGAPQIMRTETLTKNQAVFARKENVLVMKYLDKKLVHVLSTKSTAGFVDHTRTYFGNKTVFKKKPSIVEEYNQLMGSVDKADALLEPYSYERKSLAWFKKLGIHFVFRTLLNSHLIYKKQQTVQYKKDFLDFTIKVAEQLASDNSEGAKEIIQDQHVKQSVSKRRKMSGIPVIHGLIKRKPLTGQTRAPRKKCIVCFIEGTKQGKTIKEARKDTVLHCPGCDELPGLCSIDCYKKWHLRDWQRKYR